MGKAKTMKGVKNRIDVEISYSNDLSSLRLDIWDRDRKPLSGQDIINVVSETLLLRWENYDLESVPELDA